ncbi:alpha/beta fold hydrolase [Pandoraea oxalativorans]|uniref:Uncharacterized protein n=1 Tax=Pandoraea oxalativorans TaxID=573737 RepID=A0A0E3U6L2_9BURK|nr:alpha/beta hydrolase [Pandoraea oxalativorans]AKC70109.1 hypothetical protein MB84_12370 [Pandoraea oxalativorans]
MTEYARRIEGHPNTGHVVGWSDGAIQGIDLAIRYPDRVGKIVAFGVNTIKSKVLILDGEHDEGIKLEHNIYMAHTIPGAQLMILPGVSHFAFIQDPTMFNFAITHFLDH